MNRKKFSCLLSMLTLVILLAGCAAPAPTDAQPTAAAGQTADAASQTTAAPAQAAQAEPQDSLYSAPGEMPIVNQPVSLTVFAPSATDIAREDSDMTKWMEQTTGIHIDWQLTVSDAFVEKMNLMLASGSYPDMIVPGVGSRIDKVQEQQLGMQGIVIPLNEYFDTVSVGYAAAFETMPGMREYITALDGNIYSLPNVDGALHIQYQNKLWVNTVWLENVDKQMPTTVDEFYDVLVAFKQQDANGNGDPNDEIPFSAAGSKELDVFLMNPFVLTPATDRMWVDGGKIVFSPTLPGYQEGVRYLRKLYADGLMNPELFTWDTSAQKNANENGEQPVLGSVLAMRPGNFCDLSGWPDNSEKWEQYQPAAPFKGVGDNATITNYNAYQSTFQTGVCMITSACAEPEAAFRMVDFLATPEMTPITTNGLENEGWRKAAADEYGLDGKPAAITIESDKKSETWGGWDQLMGRVQTPAYLASLSYAQDPYADDVNPMQGRQVILYRSSLAYQEVSQSLESVLPPLYYPDETVDEMSLLKTTINDYVNEMLVAFVTGAKDVDADWDAFQQQLNLLGLERYLQIVQETYDMSVFAQ